MKIKSPDAIFLFPLAVFLCFAGTCCAQNEITLNITPKELVEKMIHNPEFAKSAKGETFCWNAAFGMGEFIDNFQLTKDIG